MSFVFWFSCIKNQIESNMHQLLECTALPQNIHSDVEKLKNNKEKNIKHSGIILRKFRGILTILKFI